MAVTLQALRDEAAVKSEDGRIFVVQCIDYIYITYFLIIYNNNNDNNNNNKYIYILGVDLKVHVGIVNYKGRQCYNKRPRKSFF